MGVNDGNYTFIKIHVWIRRKNNNTTSQDDRYVLANYYL